MHQTRSKLADYVSAFLTGRLYWLIIALLAVCMEAIALYYQYELGDEPCQVCIHIRIWVAAFLILSVAMLALPKRKIINSLGHLLNTVFMAGLWERCLFLLQVENGNANSSCNFQLGFPDWFALDKWMPALFEVRNLCSFTPELVFGITMAQGLMALASLLIMVSSAALLVNILKYAKTKA